MSEIIASVLCGIYVFAVYVLGVFIGRMSGKARIEQQKEQIERLQIDNLILKQKRLTLFDRLEIIENARSKAIKEFAERLKSESQYTTDRIGKLQKVVYVEDIDKVKKEMTGESADEKTV